MKSKKLYIKDVHQCPKCKGYGWIEKKHKKMPKDMVGVTVREDTASDSHLKVGIWREKRPKKS